MPLTHVCVWDSKIGYHRITVEEACELYPYEVSASGGHFVCELCAQNVGFSKARVDTGTRYFFHSSATQNKVCEDRQLQLAKAGGRYLNALNSYVMPLRISVTGSTFSLQLGFFYPPTQKAHCDKIKIAGDSHQMYEYSFERIESIGTTYLDVGTMPSRNYWLDYINANDELKRYWTNKVPGVNAEGAFFDYQSGRMLQPGGKAYSGNTYYLLQRHSLYSYFCCDIEATEITRIQTNSFSSWYLYRIRVKQFTEYAAKFFLKRSIFLTEKPTRFYPVWPPYVEEPNFIYHNANEFYFYLCGDDAELKAYPATANVLDTHDGRLYKLYTRGREQLISIGKSGALGFSYLIKQPLNRNVSPPTVVISDHVGNVLTEEIYTKLPKSKLISVSCRYDGKAIVRRKGKTEHIYKLSAERSLTIDELSFGTEIHFYQGCDYIRSIRFEQNKASFDVLALDDALVKELNACSGPMISVTHTVGTLASKFAAYPQTKKWLYITMRQGEISRKALQVLKDNSPNNCGRTNND